MVRHRSSGTGLVITVRMANAESEDFAEVYRRPISAPRGEKPDGGQGHERGPVAPHEEAAAWLRAIRRRLEERLGR